MLAYAEGLLQQQEHWLQCGVHLGACKRAAAFVFAQHLKQATVHEEAALRKKAKR
jgi:hypothetical protein